MKPFLSLCMIVKNEEKVLARCLDSVSGIVDEIIIVDTGSTDQTKAIAQRYTERVYDFQWKDDFSEARNFAQSKASGEWILVLDADEYVDRENLQAAIAEIKASSNSVDAYSVQIYNFTGLYGETIIQHHSLRIYRNDPSIYFHRAVHEQLTKENGELATARSSLVIYHSGYLAKTVQEKEKNRRNTLLIEREMKKGRNAFDYFNLGNEYLSMNQVSKALEAYKTAFQKKKDLHYSWVPFCVVQIVHCLIRLERYQDALNVIGDAEKIWPQAPDFPCLKGHVYFLQNRLEDAKAILVQLVENKARYPFIIKSIDFLEFHPHLLLGNIYEREGDVHKAVHHYSLALGFNSKSREVQYRLLSILTKHALERDVAAFIQKKGWIELPQDRIAVAQILLQLSQPSLAEQFIEAIEDEILREGLRAKSWFVRGDWDHALNWVKKKTVGELDNFIRKRCIDLYDLIILGLEKEQNLLFLLLTLVKDKKNKDFIRLLLDESVNPPLEPAYFVTLMERCLQYRRFELFERLLSKREAFGAEMNLSLGHLLYRHGFIELAVAFYREVPLSAYDDQAFVNIMEALRQQGELEDALQMALFAIGCKHVDFRIFQHAIEISAFRQEEEQKRAVLHLALEHYPDSDWLRKWVSGTKV